MSQLSIVICILLSLIAVASAVTVIDPAQFDEQVVKSDHAWLIKFYSKMCGACNDFKPTWKKVTGKLKDFSFGEISIDDKAGMKLAEKLGVLDEGLPNVRMFYQNGDKNGVSVATDETGLEASTIINNVKQIAHNLNKNDQGLYVKN